jgi:hypothetical protein
MPMDKKNNKKEALDRLKNEFTETEKVILSRRSVRQYKKEQVPEFMVKRILEAGRFAPSAGNFQPWKFIVLRDPEVIKGITESVISSCKMARAMIDYRRKGFTWLRPLVKFMTRIRYNDLHPMPFSAIPQVADGNLGLWHGAPTVIIILKGSIQPGPRLRDCRAEHGACRPQHGLGDLLGGLCENGPGYESHLEKARRYLVPVQICEQPGRWMAPWQS